MIGLAVLLLLKVVLRNYKDTLLILISINAAENILDQDLVDLLCFISFFFIVEINKKMKEKR